MSKKHRIISFIVLLAVGLLIIFFIHPTTNETVNIILYSSLIMMSFVSLLVEHYFSKPADVLSSSISILLLIIPLQGTLSHLGWIYTVLIVYNSVLIIMSLVALFLLNGDMPTTAIRNKWSSILKDIAVRFGNGKLMFFVVFLASLLGFVDAHSIEFIILLIYSLLIWSCQPQTGL